MAKTRLLLEVSVPTSVLCTQSGLPGLDLVPALRHLAGKGLHLPLRACTEYFYLPQHLGGMGIPSVEDESGQGKHLNSSPTNVIRSYVPLL